MIRFIVFIFSMLPALVFACGEELSDPMFRIIGWGTLLFISLTYFAPVLRLLVRPGAMPYNTKVLLALSVLTLAMSCLVMVFTREALFGVVLLFNGLLMPLVHLVVTRKSFRKVIDHTHHGFGRTEGFAQGVPVQ